MAAAFGAALLFDCDGVIVETEELHRRAYNSAFRSFGLEVGGEPVNWSTEYYDHLANTVGGGKPKMRYHFTDFLKLGFPGNAGAWPAVTAAAHARPTPANEEEGMALVDELQDAKTEFYKQIVDEAATARPGVLELMDAAIAAPGLAIGICSAATRAGFERVVNSVRSLRPSTTPCVAYSRAPRPLPGLQLPTRASLASQIVGAQRLGKLDIIIAGDDVTAKKPDPMIYNLAAERLGLPSAECVVIEDSLVGLRAAVGAGMPCLITYTPQTAAQDFYGEGAAAKVPDLGVGVTLDGLFALAGASPSVQPDLASAVRDPKEAANPTGAYEYAAAAAIY